MFSVGSAKIVVVLFVVIVGYIHTSREKSLSDVYLFAKPPLAVEP
jgi:hypothetical protein